MLWKHPSVLNCALPSCTGILSSVNLSFSLKQWGKNNNRALPERVTAFFLAVKNRLPGQGTAFTTRALWPRAGAAALPAWDQKGMSGKRTVPCSLAGNHPEHRVGRRSSWISGRCLPPVCQRPCCCRSSEWAGTMDEQPVPAAPLAPCVGPAAQLRDTLWIHTC